MNDALRKRLLAPDIRLHGQLNDEMLDRFLDGVQQLQQQDSIVVELMTPGGDADIGRRIAMEVRLCRRYRGQQTYFLGKTAVMSAGITVMAAFERNCRFLTDDTELLIHERRIKRSLSLSGPLQAEVQIVSELLAELKSGQRLEDVGFKELVRGSSLTVEELKAKALENCYLSAAEALELGLVEAIL